MSYSITDSSGTASKALQWTERGSALAQLLSVHALLFRYGALKCDMLTTPSTQIEEGAGEPWVPPIRVS